MVYHVKLQTGVANLAQWNLTRAQVIKELLLPFINGQVIQANNNGKSILLNMKSVMFLQVFKTVNHLAEPNEGSTAPEEMLESTFEQHECTDEIVKAVKLLQAAPEFTSLLQKALSEPRKQVFVVMKYGDKLLDSAYEGVMRVVIEEYGLKPIRSDKVQDSESITPQVLESIATSRYVLIDLSGERPNCYYEAGFAHALGKKIIFTVRKQDPIHFDLSQYRFIIWETEHELRVALRERFSSLLVDPEADFEAAD